jgi:PAS domain S-box-containing protein
MLFFCIVFMEGELQDTAKESLNEELSFLRTRVAELEGQIQHSGAEQRLPHDGSCDLSGREPDEVVQKIVWAAVDRLFFDRAEVFLIDRQKSCLRGTWGIDQNGDIASNADVVFPLSGESGALSKAALVALGKLPYYLTQGLDHPYRESKEGDIEANLAVPIRAGDRIIGVLVTDNYFTRQPISDERVGWLMALANQGGGALLNVQAFNDIQEAYENLFHEVMERKMEEALRESEKRFRSIIKNVPDIIYRSNRKGEITFISEAVCRYGYAVDDLLGRPILELFHPEDRKLVRSHIEEPRNGTPRSQSFEGRLLPKGVNYQQIDASQMPVFLVHIENLHTSSGEEEWLGTQGVARDITERKRGEEILLQSSRLVSLGQMAAGMAHELNQPLTAISVIAEGTQLLMKQGIEIAAEDYLEWSKDLLGQVERMSNLINHLRLFSRDYTEEKKEDVAINNVVRTALEMTSAQLQAHSISLGLELEKDLGPVLGNRHRLEQVVLNLVANARDALDEKERRRRQLGLQIGEKRLQIRTRRGDCGEKILLEVEDTGQGINEEHQHQLFQPFFTTKEPDRGTGLGLSVSYAIVKDHGGNISCQSQEGKGSRFLVELPESEPSIWGKVQE